MTIDYVWHFDGGGALPPELRAVPLELSDSDLSALTQRYALMLYRDQAQKVVLARDTPRGRFRQR